MQKRFRLPLTILTVIVSLATFLGGFFILDKIQSRENKTAPAETRKIDMGTLLTAAPTPSSVQEANAQKTPKPASKSTPTSLPILEKNCTEDEAAARITVKIKAANGNTLSDDAQIRFSPKNPCSESTGTFSGTLKQGEYTRSFAAATGKYDLEIVYHGIGETYNVDVAYPETILTLTVPD